MSCSNIPLPASESLPLNASEKEPERFFQCPICLDLAYKPVVRSCGHVFCFWCTLHSMDGIRQSKCPLCRRACSHFPKICEMLHFLLMKLMPEEYGRRAKETQEYEKSEQMSSPDIIPSWRHCKYDYSSKLLDKCSTDVSASTSGGLNCLQSPSMSIQGGKDIISLQQQSLCEDQTCNYLSASEKSYLRPDKCATHVLSATKGGIESRQSPLELSERGQEEGQLHSFSGDQISNDLSEVDFSCTACKQILYKPVVLHCGEVFCQGCLDSDSIISCPACCGAHPGGSVDICLDLQHYLERAYPESVLERKADASQNGAKWTEKGSSKNAYTVDSIQSVWKGGNGDHQVTEEIQAVHFLAGCDGCGMHPIIGDRYHCEDCPERVGYDLCGDCYEKGTDCHGRFNQQHTANHHMRKVLRERVSVDVLSSYYAVFLASGDSSENSANGHDDMDDMETES